MKDKEQTISNLRKLKSFHNGSYGTDIDRAIKALEQEPCEDCISRQAVIKHLHNEYHGMISDESMKIYEIINMLKEQPSVTPQPKTGGWIEHFDESGKWYECDQCHTDWGGPVNYCPNCGKNMEGDKR